MEIDISSFAFGSKTRTRGGTPSWGTSLGQSPNCYHFAKEGYERIIEGLVFNVVPLKNVMSVSGRGGKELKNCDEVDIFQMASVFKKVYLNGVKIDSNFILLLTKEQSESHNGRRNLKYHPDTTYVGVDDDGKNISFSNKDFLSEVYKKFNLGEKSCWFIYDIDVLDFETLIFKAYFVDKYNNVEYKNSSIRGDIWKDLISEDSETKSQVQKSISLLPATIPYQTIYYGAPGTGKSYIIKQLTKDESVVRTTFHPDSDYSTFVGAYKPTTKTIELRDLSGHKVVEDGCVVKEEKIVYEFVEQAFLKAYIQAWKYLIDLGEVSDEPQKQFLIIEEINRGNCAQVFGDLFQLLDRNSAGFSEYPICADNDMQKQLQKAFSPLRGCSLDEIKQQFAELYDDSQMLDRVLNGEVILLPGNMFIWATMNTSDQSLFPIDSAFKRRWDWHYMPIAQGYDREGNPMQWTIDICGTEYDWWKFLNAINKHIGEVHSSEDKKLGFFFCKAEDGMIDAETFVGKVIFYLWNDVFKDFLYEGTLFRDKEGSLITFDRFYNVNPNGNITVNPDMVRIFLNNLGVERLQDSGEANMAETSAEQSDENSDEEVTA